MFTAPQPVLMMYTSSSRTDSAIVTFVSPIPLRVISAFERGSPMLEHEVNECRIQELGGVEFYRRAMSSASSGWLVPTNSRLISPRTDPER